MSRLSLSTIESAANTFTNTAQVTGLEGQTTQAFRVLEARFETDFARIGTAAGDGLQFALTRQVKTAMPNVADVDVLFKYAARTIAGGLTGIESDIITWKPEGEVIIVEDPIHLCVLGVSAAAAYTVVGELFYEVVSISAIDRLTLLTQSLSGA